MVFYAPEAYNTLKYSMQSLKEQTQQVVQKEIVDKNHVIFTLDGSTTAGKRVAAERLADRYGITMFNTGTTIRTMALLAIENGVVKTDDTNITTVPVDFAEQIIRMYDTMPDKLRIEKPRDGERTARVMVGDRDMRGELLAYRKQKAIDNLSAVIASSPLIRDRLYGLWRDAVDTLGGVIVVGRKTGIDLFPHAQVKLYLFASPQASAVYRVTHDPTSLMHQSTEERYVRERDGLDRENGLLDRPADAFSVDTSMYISHGDGKNMTELENLIARYIDSKVAIR